MHFKAIRITAVCFFIHSYEMVLNNKAYLSLYVTIIKPPRADKFLSPK